MNWTENAGKRIINVSNRLPLKLSKTESGLEFRKSEGGLATGLNTLFQRYESLWIGWPGAILSPEEHAPVTQQLNAQHLHPVFLSQEEINDYYEGFCNDTIWPLFHYFPSCAKFLPQYMEAYTAVNKKFADEIRSFATKDDIVWIHDYQLMLVPELVRASNPDIAIGYFLHIPFPSYQVFRSLPWRKEILNGLLGADHIGFQTPDDVQNFKEAVERILNIACADDELRVNGRAVSVNAFPISIDYNRFAELAASEQTIGREATLKAQMGDCKLAISVDRLDYSKGILHRLQAYDRFLERYPAWRERMTLMHLIVPSRDTVPMYSELKEEMNRLITEINGKYATLTWQPIQHFYRSFPDDLLSAMYKTADVALVTPLRDGMNLVSKEFIASNVNQQGVLVLSEAAGAARELTDAIIVNPNDQEQFAEAIFTALTMDTAEKRARMSRMQLQVRSNDIFKWSANFMEGLESLHHRRTSRPARTIDSIVLEKIDMNYRYATKRLVLLDYDGTLVGFVNNPNEARPDQYLLQLLSSLSNDPQNTVVIISGRDHHTLDAWLGHLPVKLIAEHGVWRKTAGTGWEMNGRVDTRWKNQYATVLQSFTDATPGSFIEEKTCSLAWHYRQSEEKLGDQQAAALIRRLETQAAADKLQLLHGHKVIEVKTAGMNKGKALSWVLHDQYDFVLAIGDDTTDEDMFHSLGDTATTIRVGTRNTAAKYWIKTQQQVRPFLYQLHKSSQECVRNISTTMASSA